MSSRYLMRVVLYGIVLTLTFASTAGVHAKVQPGVEAIDTLDTQPTTSSQASNQASCAVTIVFNYVPPLGSTDYLRGKVDCVDPNKYGVLVYIFTGGGWWVKPTFATPLTRIAADGSWSTRIVSAGVDPQATVISAFIVPTNFAVPALDGVPNLPSVLFQNALAFAGVLRSPTAAPITSTLPPPCQPSLVFTYVPAYGNRTEHLRGKVNCVNPNSYAALVIVYTGGGWWNKPTFENPLTNIAASGEFDARIVTGGVDHLATAIAVYIVPRTFKVPLLDGVPALPPELAQNALTSIQVQRSPQ